MSIYIRSLRSHSMTRWHSFSATVHAAQIARRVHSLEYVQGHALSKAGRTRAVRYMPQALAEDVYLHPQSALAKAAPEFVVYMQILRTEKRPYLAGDQLWLNSRSSPDKDSAWVP